MTKQELLELHEDTMNKCRLIMQKKNADYTGGSEDPFANFRVSEVMGVPAEQGILLRVMDKMQRIKSFILKGELKVENESAEDACEDVINYMILIKGMMRDSSD